jgi:hypothetical protein
MTPKPDGPADKTAIDFDMAVLISGQTYPIKDNEVILYIYIYIFAERVVFVMSNTTSRCSS